MVWQTPATFVPSQMVTAANLNAMRDNFLETAPAKATTAGRIIVTTGPNSIAERQVQDSIVETSESTSSVAYTALTTDGPTVTVPTGVHALVLTNCQMNNSAVNGTSVASFEISGATSTGVSDVRSIIFQAAITGQDFRAGAATLMATTAGTNTFRMLYRVTAGTGTFVKRRMQIMAL